MNTFHLCLDMTHNNSPLRAAQKIAPVLHSLISSLSPASSQAMASHSFTSTLLPVCTAGNTVHSGMFFKDSHYATLTSYLLIRMQSDPLPLSHLTAVYLAIWKHSCLLLQQWCNEEFLLLFYRGTEWLSDLFKVSSRAHSWSRKMWTPLKNRELFIVCLLDNSDITCYFPVIAVLHCFSLILMTVSQICE